MWARQRNQLGFKRVVFSGSQASISIFEMDRKDRNRSYQSDLRLLPPWCGNTLFFLYIYIYIYIYILLYAAGCWRVRVLTSSWSSWLILRPIVASALSICDAMYTLTPASLVGRDNSTWTIVIELVILLIVTVHTDAVESFIGGGERGRQLEMHYDNWDA